MKKMYEQPLLKRNKAKMDLCILKLSLDDRPAEPTEETATKRRDFLNDDDADWDLGF